MKLSKNDYGILSTLLDHNCTNELKSYSIKQLCEVSSLSVNKIRGTIRTFLFLNYVEEGANQHNAKTFYITQEGILKINSLK